VELIRFPKRGLEDINLSGDRQSNHHAADPVAGLD
jgi:hypothetical protein